MKKLLLGTVLSMFSLSIFAADLWIEPFLGYGIGTVKATATALGTNYDIKYSYNGADFGGRLGIRTWGLLAGVQYDMMKAKLTLKESSGLTGLSNTDSDISNLGLYLGYELPLFFKVWGTYYISSKDKRSSATVKSDGGYSLGIGYRPISIIGKVALYFNAEYRAFSYKDYTSGTATLKNNKYNEVLLSISTPIAL